MLTKHDIEFMKCSVRETICDWQTSIIIMQPLPLDKQNGYNKLMHEFSGNIEYETIVVHAERKDIVNNSTNDISPDDTEYGIKNAGTILYAIPNVLPVLDENGIQTGVKLFKPHKESVIAIDDTNDRYYIQSMRDRIGEVLIVIKRYTGNIPAGTETISEMPVDGLIGDDDSI